MRVLAILFLATSLSATRGVSVLRGNILNLSSEQDPKGKDGKMGDISDMDSRKVKNCIFFEEPCKLTCVIDEQSFPIHDAVS
jgi:hypothetical protein